MRYLFLLSVSLLLITCSSTNSAIYLGDVDYSERNILLELGANSTIRASETTLEVYNPSKAVYVVKEAMTIYDKEDKDLATIVLDYGDFKTVDYLKANIFDKDGRYIRSFSLDDAGDYSTSWGSTFYSDVRLKMLELPYSSFPYTIEFEYQQTYSGLLNLPDWRPQQFGQSVESASFTLIDRTGNGVRYYNKNLDEGPVESNLDTYKKYTWDINMLMPVESEMLGYSSSEILPHVLVAPVEFKMENSIGNASNWSDFGLWYYELGKDTRILPEAAKREVDVLIQGITSEEEKVRVLFNYLQDKARYVSIQLGIGGWKPFSAEYVFNNSYGDCKALTNYMHAVLDYAGIKAESVLIYNGVRQPGMEVEFPSNQFNHVILRVTLENGDVIWLECTSKYLPPNHIGAGNAGKFALLITPEGGEVIKTPEMNFNDNKSDRYWRLSIDSEGNTNLHAEVTSKGLLQDDLLYDILPVSEKERLEWLENSLDVDQIKVEEYDFSKVLNLDGNASYSFIAKLDNYTRTSNKRFFIPVNKLNRWRFSISDDDKRKQPVSLPYTFAEEDSILIQTPFDYEIESAPKDIEYVYPFGEFRASFIITENQEILYKRYFSVKEKEISSDKYPELKEFFDKVRFADQQQIVMVKKEDS